MAYTQSLKTVPSRRKAFRFATVNVAEAGLYSGLIR